jgi:hypothetical protein
MLMRDENGIQGIYVHVDGLQRLDQGTGAFPGINENAGAGGFQISGVPCGTGIKRAKAIGHGSPLILSEKQLGQVAVPDEQVQRLTQEDHDEGDDDGHHPTGFLSTDAVAIYKGLLFFVAPLGWKHICGYIFIDKGAVIGKVTDNNDCKGNEIRDHDGLCPPKTDTSVVDKKEKKREDRGYDEPLSEDRRQRLGGLVRQFGETVIFIR